MDIVDILGTYGYISKVTKIPQVKDKSGNLYVSINKNKIRINQNGEYESNSGCFAS